MSTATCMPANLVTHRKWQKLLKGDGGWHHPFLIFLCDSLQMHVAFSKCINCWLFSRSYCYKVWSAIDRIRSSVRLSVCLWRCALWLSGLVYRATSCTTVFLADKFLFVRSDIFAVRCIVLLQNVGLPEKRVEENAKVIFWDTENQAQTGWYTTTLATCG